MHFFLQGVSQSKANKTRKQCRIMGFVVFIGKRPPLLVKIYLRDSGKKCSWMTHLCYVESCL